MRYVFAFLLLAGRLAQAQCCPYVQPVQVLPANPTATDNIRLVFQATTPNRGQRLSTSFTRVGNTLTFTGCYFSGLLTQLQSYSDTVQVGMLPAGAYSIVFVARQSADPQQCIEQQRNGSTRTVQVSSPVLAMTRNQSSAGALYPVPATGRQLLFQPATNHRITGFQLLDAAGHVCAAQDVASPRPDNQPLPLNLPALPAGSYLLRVTYAEQAPATYRLALE